MKRPDQKTPRRRLVALAVSLTVILPTATISATATPVWAAPQPVSPSVQTRPIGGVDAAALTVDPPAFDPAQAAAAIPGTAARVSRSTAPTVLTGQIQTGRFTAAGVSWRGSQRAQDAVVQVRVRERGTWSDWKSLTSEDDADPGSPDARHSGGRHSTAPIVSGDADAVQVRVDPSSPGSALALRDLSLTTVDGGRTAADATLSAAAPAAVQDTRAPAIITRAGWGADESLRDCSPTYSATLKVGFVHHTVNANTYTAAESAGLVRGIYAYHVNGMGWCDIGYQFLVDRFGQIFEGRAGGMDRPVIGAQAGGFNTDSFGVAAIGDFSSATPPTVMLEQMSRVLGWKLGLHGRDPGGRTTLTSAGGDATSYPVGRVVPLNVVSGHRDVDLTGCPMNVYDYLPSMRVQAAQYAAANTLRGEDLYGILGENTGSGRVEVHAQSASSTYSQRMVDAASALGQGGLDDWRFLVGSSVSDTRPDLIAVRLRGGASGRVEVHVMSWASGYRDFTVHAATPLAPMALDGTTQVTVGGPGGGNLYFIAYGTTGSGTVEVHALSSSSSYTQFLVRSPTALGANTATADARYLVAKGSGDLYAILHGTRTGSGRTEVHALSAASGYRQFVMHTATPAGPTLDRSAVWALGTAPTPDVFFVPVSGTGSGAVEVHRLSPSSSYSTWTLHAATSLPAGSYPGWQFGFG